MLQHQPPKPDLVFGDQSYDHTEHTAAWQIYLQFREVFRNRPCITIPMITILDRATLGEYGKKASSSAGNDGGYFYHPNTYKWWNAHKLHCPILMILPRFIKNRVYYTNLVLGVRFCYPRRPCLNRGLKEKSSNGSTPRSHQRPQLRS